MSDIYNCSWAQQSDASYALFNVRSGAGFAGFSGTGFTAMGKITSVNVQTFADGEHVTVTADVTFSHIAGGIRTDFLPAEAVYHGLVAPDGKQTEGAYFTDAVGNILAHTEDTALVVRGRICLS